MADLLTSGLNDAQQKAVNHRDGPLAIYAGAGSGKTRVIVHRMAKLMATGVPGSSIMAVTFTNKAAREMKDRLSRLATSGGAEPFNARNVLVSTFHAAAAKFLRMYATDLGYSAHFTIADDGDQKSILKQIVKEWNIPETVASPATLKSKIDRLKNRGLTPAAYAASLQDSDGGDDERSRSLRSFGERIDSGLVAKVFEAYQNTLKRSDAMDFNDLLVNMVLLLQTSSRAREQLAFRYRYFLIDEFQDTNPVQFQWIQLLAGHTRNLCIVGDDDQSIYSWRGAEPRFIVDFAAYYPDATVIKLEQNYRSCAHIIHAASTLIGQNTIRAAKTLWTDNPPGSLIRVVTHYDNSEEGLSMAEEIVRAASSGVPYSHYAILYRTNAQSRVIEDELRRKMLPYIIYGSVRFYERAEVKIILTYLRLLLNFRDDLAFAKCIATPKRGFGEKALETLSALAREQQLSTLQTAVRIVYGELPNPFARGLSGLRKFVELYTHLKIKLDAGESGVRILESLLHGLSYEEHLRASYPEDFDERWLNIVELQNALSEFLESHEPGENHPLADFLESASLMTEPTSRDVAEGSAEAVSLMTIHAAKGLEFERVYVCGLEEGVLPHLNSMDTPAEVEEERRLLYVAMTRARRELTLTSVKCQRFRRDLPTQKSRFLAELPDEDVSIHGQSSFSAPISSRSWSNSRAWGNRAAQTQASQTYAQNAHHQGSAQMSHSELLQKLRSVTSAKSENLPNGQEDNGPNSCPFVTGQKVRHKIFGDGIITSIEASVGTFRLEIRFAQVGVKKLMHSFVTAIETEPSLHNEEDLPW